MCPPELPGDGPPWPGGLPWGFWLPELPGVEPGWGDWPPGSEIPAHGKRLKQTATLINDEQLKIRCPIPRGGT